MAQVIREKKYLDETPMASLEDTTNIAARVVYVISGIITGLLAIRFLLSLLGANPLNSFANIIYDLSRPLVAPFFGLFNYNAQLGVARFEFETLIAIVVYGLIAWVLVNLLSSGRGSYPEN